MLSKVQEFGSAKTTKTLVKFHIKPQAKGKFEEDKFMNDDWTPRLHGALSEHI